MNKEECLKACETLIDKTCIKCDMCISQRCESKFCEIGEAHTLVHRLINEHFDNPPLKFEELKEGMWIWDDKDNWYEKIKELLTIRNDNYIKFDQGDGDYIKVKFEEEKFYAREVK